MKLLAEVSGRPRATTAAAAPDEVAAADQHEPKANQLRDVILGGQDGLVNILGIILGVIAGGGSRPVLIAAGFAAAITESISMGAVGYTSTNADRDYYRGQRRRALAEICRALPGTRSAASTPRKASAGSY